MCQSFHETLLERNKQVDDITIPAPTISEQVALGRVFETTLVNCGGSQFKDVEVQEAHKSRLPDHPEIDDMVFGAFDNVEQSVRDDLHILKTSPYVPKRIADQCFGYVYDIKTGLLTPVDYVDDQ
ncbi:hypothetical protein ACHAPE_009860 [Trichoderma viride]